MAIIQKQIPVMADDLVVLTYGNEHLLGRIYLSCNRRDRNDIAVHCTVLLDKEQARQLANELLAYASEGV